MKINVGFVGAGLQVRRRIPAILSAEGSNVVGITSRTLKTARALGKKFNIRVYDHWKDLVANPTIDVVVVATPPFLHAKISIEALKRGKHVLCEKPLAKTLKEAEEIVKTARRVKRILKCGFNHRFHPAIVGAKEIVEKGKIGNLLFGRGIYGYCGRPDFEKEWRSNPKYVSGGILMEQGIHLIDLFRWFFGEFEKVQSSIDRMYFPISPFEDNAFVLLKTKQIQVVSLHSTILQWKNTFIFELYGTKGYIRAEGLGGSYGTEKLIVGLKDYHGPFKEELVEFRGEDVSWNSEWEGFLDNINHKREQQISGDDGLEAIRIVEAAYESSRKNKVILI